MGEHTLGKAKPHSLQLSQTKNLLVLELLKLELFAAGQQALTATDQVG